MPTKCHKSGKCPFLKSIKYFLVNDRLFVVGKLDCGLRIFCSVIVVAILIIATIGTGNAMQVMDRASYSGVMPGLNDQQKVVFLEHNMIANGSVINGTVPFRTVNFPSYWFNANTGQLNGDIDFPINRSLQLIFGDVLTLTGNFGDGTGNKLYGAYSLPARADKAIIYSVDRTGSIIMDVNNRMLILKPGDVYSYSENETLSEGNGTVKVRYDHTYTNHGLIDKNGIRTSMVAEP